MGKYEQLMKAVFSIFASEEWQERELPVHPENFKPEKAVAPFIRLNFVPRAEGLNRLSVSGQLILDIYTSVGEGPKPYMLIADLLDEFLVEKTLETEWGCVQFGRSTMVSGGVDRINRSLHQGVYTIPFNFFGVL